MTTKTSDMGTGKLGGKYPCLGFNLGGYEHHYLLGQWWYSRKENNGPVVACAKWAVEGLKERGLVK